MLQINIIRSLHRKWEFGIPAGMGMDVVQLWNGNGNRNYNTEMAGKKKTHFRSPQTSSYYCNSMYYSMADAVGQQSRDDWTASHYNRPSCIYKYHHHHHHHRRHHHSLLIRPQGSMKTRANNEREKKTGKKDLWSKIFLR